MSVLGECLTHKHEFEHNGKQYQVSLIDLEIELAWEKRIFARAKEAAKAMKELMDEKEYSAHLKSLNNDYISGEFSLIGPQGNAALQKPDGLMALSAMLFHVDDNEMKKLFLARKTDIEAMLEIVLKESYPNRVVTTEADPKKK